jgi:phosphate acetyltransferase
MGAEGIVVDKLEDVGPALKKAIDMQMNEGKTCIIEIMCTRELGDPFRRDALAKPVRFLESTRTTSDNPAIASTLDAAALCKMADRGQITGAVLDGPLAYDNAISSVSAINKGIVSEVAGRPDILLLPNLEAGNMIYKQLVYMAGAECAGLVLGMKVPIILTSRSDSITARITSCALAVLVASQGGSQA